MTLEPTHISKVPLDPMIGTKVGDYVIDVMIGRGGMGFVYRASHPLIQRQVAVKVIKPEVAADPELARRFFTEAQALSAVKHRGITDVISFGSLPDGRQYLIMELLAGEGVDLVLAREGSLDPVRALGLCDELLDALSAAHHVGVVHRDLKPGNLFLAEQSNGSKVLKVVDFGLARVTASSATPTEKASVVAGTPQYISPEQALGRPATPSSDLYCTGVILFELLTGRLPFLGDGVFELLRSHIEVVPPRVSEFARVPASLDDLVAQLLEKDPQARPSSAALVRNGLRKILRELQQQSTRVSVPLTGPTRPVEVAPQTSPAVPPTGPQPIPRLVFGLIVALGLALLAVAGLLWGILDRPKPLPSTPVATALPELTKAPDPPTPTLVPVVPAPLAPVALEHPEPAPVPLPAPVLPPARVLPPAPVQQPPAPPRVPARRPAET